MHPGGDGDSPEQDVIISGSLRIAEKVGLLLAPVLRPEGSGQDPGLWNDEAESSRQRS